MNPFSDLPYCYNVPKTSPYAGTASGPAAFYAKMIGGRVLHSDVDARAWSFYLALLVCAP